ncbi:MAG: DUF4293 domain-containing protein [Cyclobacteriaceae bacterium]
MLQRVQSLFLAGVIIAMAVALLLPVWEEVHPNTNESLTVHTWYSIRSDASGVQETIYVPYLAAGVLVMITCIVAVVEFFKYNNRPTQLKLGKLNSLLLMAVLGLLFYLVYTQEDKILPNENGDYQAGIILPIVALLLNFMAGKFINKDEKLVRSVDRIR